MRSFTLMFCGLGVIATAFAYGVYAGRHGGLPATMVLRVKSELTRRFAPNHHWRRDFNDATHAAREMICPADPIVIVTGGQSNAANHLSDPVDARDDLPAAMWFDGRCYRLADPLLGATGQGGSLWAELGHRIARETGRGVVLINGGVTATTFADWTTLDSGYLERLERNVMAARAQGLRPSLVLWHQGESDAHARRTAAEFQAPLERLVLQLRARIAREDPVPLVIFRASVCTGARANGNATLIAAQTLLAAKLTNVVLGPNTDQLGPRYRYDGCHFNARGRARVVEETLALLLPLLRRDAR